MSVLLTTDLSESSKVAFPVAKRLALALGLKLKIVAVIEDIAQAAMLYAIDFPIYPSPDIQKQLVDKVTVDLNALVKEQFNDVKVELFVREATGPVYQEIVALAKEHKSEFLIMASHGRSGLTRVLLGSVTEKVVRESPCPVVVVPSHGSNK